MGCLFVIVPFALLFLIAWLADVLPKFVETRRYRAKLKRLKPQLEAIDRSDLRSRFSVLQDNCASSVEQLRRKYNLGEHDTEIPIHLYVERDASYQKTRSKASGKKKRRVKTYKKRPWRYRRYY